MIKSNYAVQLAYQHLAAKYEQSNENVVTIATQEVEHEERQHYLHFILLVDVLEVRKSEYLVVLVDSREEKKAVETSVTAYTYKTFKEAAIAFASGDLDESKKQDYTAIIKKNVIMSLERDSPFTWKR